MFYWELDFKVILSRTWWDPSVCFCVWLGCYWELSSMWYWKILPAATLHVWEPNMKNVITQSMQSAQNPTGHSVFLALEADPPFILPCWFFLAEDLKYLKRIYLQLCFLWVCRHGWALGYGIYHESYSNVLIVTLVVWNSEYCLLNELHSKELISIPKGCCLCVVPICHAMYR